MKAADLQPGQLYKVANDWLGNNFPFRLDRVESTQRITKSWGGGSSGGDRRAFGYFVAVEDHSTVVAFGPRRGYALAKIIAPWNQAAKEAELAAAAERMARNVEAVHLVCQLHERLAALGLNLGAPNSANFLKIETPERLRALLELLPQERKLA